MEDIYNLQRDNIMCGSLVYFQVNGVYQGFYIKENTFNSLMRLGPYLL